MQRARRTPVPAAPVAEPRDEALLERESQPELELADVPAAVVCAFCGRPDCPGCVDVDEPTNASGVVAIVPWERPGLGWLGRLWATARLATLSHRELFSSLPEGELAAPLRFAVLAESLAALGLAVCGAGLFALVPDLAATIARDPVLRQIALRALGFGLPGLVALMIGLHALHGVLVDRAARSAGSRRRGRGLRFGLYACGWDLVTLPVGLLVVALSEGLGAAGQAAKLALSVPNHATRAYLLGVHGLAPDAARKATQRASLGVGVGALLGVAVLALLAALAAR